MAVRLMIYEKKIHHIIVVVILAATPEPCPAITTESIHRRSVIFERLHHILGALPVRWLPLTETFAGDFHTAGKLAPQQLAPR